jgi:lipopolysaccharide/colanic/teichoic acid biosynthesis glycosyltransferase
MLFPSGIPILKRIVDLTLVIIGLPIILLIIIGLTLLVLFFHGWPIFFTQTRPGYHGRPIQIIKFRSMTDARDADGNLLPDELRLTWLGRFLRSFSLDELPELINVVRGDMSLVGPRPLLMQYLERYTPEQARRHDVLPGITGWAQVNGRNALTWEDKFRLDVWYVDNWSLTLDFKILLLNVSTVLSRRGINQPGHATAEEFMGSNTKHE